MDYHDVGFQTEIHFNSTASPQAELCTTREVSHKQNYDQGGSPQPELRPGSLHTYAQAELRPGSWLQAGWLAELRPGSLLLLLFLGVVGIDVGVFVYYFEEKSGQDSLLA